MILRLQGVLDPLVQSGYPGTLCVSSNEKDDREYNDISLEISLGISVSTSVVALLCRPRSSIQ
jgi:hypothetical protein